MTNTTTRSSTRAFWLILLVALWSLGLKAQIYPNPVLVWDKEVGCIEYYEKMDQDNYNLYEQIAYGVCLRVCENSIVSYILNDREVVSVDWEVTGGELQRNTNRLAIIKWGAYGNGSLTVHITYTNGHVESLTLCVEKILSPKALFQVDGIQPEQNQFCVDMPISFDNLSNNNGGTDIVNYLWDFGDGTTSSTFEPTHTYTREGVYNVKLTVTNSCNCSTTYEKKFSIKPEKIFEITCPSIVCEYSTETYSVNDGCGGKWEVKGGRILNNHGTSIEVTWDNIDPLDGFGYISYLSNCACPVWSTVKVPVIVRKGKIKGPQIVCQDEQSLFSMPQWPTTEFEWMINSNPNHPMLAHTDQRNEIFVNGTQPGTYTLSVRYKNTLLTEMKCEGEAVMSFTIAPKPEIVTNSERTLCRFTPQRFDISNGAPVQWTITRNGATVYTFNGSSMQYNFPESGTHIITASYNGCVTDPVIRDVIDSGEINGTIEGSTKVCFNTPYTYTISENEPGFTYVWSITGGSIIGTSAGTSVDVEFRTAGTISVVRQKIQNGVVCSSEPVTLNVQGIKYDPRIINDSGLLKFCQSSSETFSLDLDGVTPDHIAWSITAESGQTNFASIINGINSNRVSVNFHNISASGRFGILKVELTKCGTVTTRTYRVELAEQPTLTVDPVPGICPESNSFNLRVSTPPPFTSGFVRISLDGDQLSDPIPYTSGQYITVPHNFDNDSDITITKSLTVLLETCGYTVTSSQTLIIFPSTKIYITPSYDIFLCPGDSAQLYSSISTGSTASASYRWYKDNVPLNVTTSNITVSSGGTYRLQVTDINGCITYSDDIYVTESCPELVPGGCTISPTPTITVAPRWASCNEMRADLTYTGNPTYFNWKGLSRYLKLDPATQNTPNARFTTDVPGLHRGSVNIGYGDCKTTRYFNIVKNYKAEMDITIACGANNNYNVTLRNKSKIFDIQLGDITFNYTGGPNNRNVSNNTGASYTDTNVAPGGTYYYTLKLSSPGKPDCSVVVSVTIPPTPNVVLPPDPTVYCTDDVITLGAPDYTPSSQYRWFFNGTSYTTREKDIELQFPAPGDNRIYLEVTNRYGCTYRSNTIILKTHQTDFRRGEINPNPADFCVVNGVPLSFTPATPIFSTLTDIIWMRDDQEVGTGMTYQPLRSGSYWPVLIDQFGCKSYEMSLFPKNYRLRQLPFVMISGKTTVCFGESLALTGITTDDNLEYRWEGTQVPANLSNWSTLEGNKRLNISTLTPGTYEYTFYTRVTHDASCENSETITVNVYPEVPRPTISYTVVNCQPYTLRLTAIGPNQGMYNWSNGMSGKTIEVHHGGAYSVTYTTIEGCSATGSIQAPHNPERSLWVVPQGCYNVCNAYLLGPLGQYQRYEWQLNGNTTQSGSNGFIPNQPIQNGGAYQLFITQQGCTYGSTIPTITFNPIACPQQECPWKVTIETIDKFPGGLRYFVRIDNHSGSAQTIHLSSVNGYGTFAPATHAIGIGTTTFVVDFYINGTYTPGVMDQFIISGANCMYTVKLRLDETERGSYALEAPSLLLSPNPTRDVTTAVYNIGTSHENAQYLVVYDLLGVQRYKQKIKERQAEVVVAIGHLAQGTYLISLEADGKRIATEKLIKK